MRNAVAAGEQPASQAAQQPARPVRAWRVGWTERNRVETGFAFDYKARRAEHLGVPGGVGHPPLSLATGAVEPDQRSAPSPERASEIDLVGAEEASGAHRADRRQRP